MDPYQDPYQSPQAPSGSHGAYRIANLEVGEILNQAIQLTKNHFGLLLGIVAVALLPMHLLQMIIVTLAVPNFARGGFNPQPGAPPQFTPEMQAELVRMALLVIPLALINGFLVTPITNAAMIHAIASKYLGAPVTIGTAFGKAFSRLLPLLGTWIIVGLTVGVGMLLCCVPGIIAFFFFALATQVVVLEGSGVFNALSRSRFLMKDNYLKLFLLMLIIIGINIGLNLVMRVVTAIVPTLLASSILGLAVGIVMMIFYSALFVVFYFSARCKNENFDLDILAASVVEPPLKQL